MDPPVTVTPDTIPAGVSSVLITFCFREIDNLSDSLTHCPLGIRTFSNDNIDAPIRTLIHQPGAATISPEYPSGVGLLVCITGIKTDDSRITLGTYLTGRIGGAPGTLVTTCPTRTVGGDGNFVEFNAVVGVNCIPGFTGAQCNTTGTEAPSTVIPSECPTTNEPTTADLSTTTEGLATVVTTEEEAMTTIMITTELITANPATLSTQETDPTSELFGNVLLSL